MIVTGGCGCDGIVLQEKLSSRHTARGNVMCSEEEVGSLLQPDALHERGGGCRRREWKSVRTGMNMGQYTMATSKLQIWACPAMLLYDEGMGEHGVLDRGPGIRVVKERTMTGDPRRKGGDVERAREQFDAPDMFPLRLPLACSTLRPSPREQRLGPIVNRQPWRHTR